MITIQVLDISQYDIKTAVSFIPPDDESAVQIDGLGPHEAVVRWTQINIAGLNFVQALGFEELAKWVRPKALHCWCLVNHT
jgi:hypothetical protein